MSLQARRLRRACRLLGDARPATGAGARGLRAAERRAPGLRLGITLSLPR